MSYLLRFLREQISREKISITVFLLLFATGCAFRQPEFIRVTTYDQLSALVGKRVELIGVVSDMKCPDVLGVDLWELDSHRGKTVRVRGRLQQQIVTEEHLAKLEKKLGMSFAHRGPGTFYSLEKMSFEVVTTVQGSTP